MTRVKTLLSVIALAGLSGCATTGSHQSVEDPFENTNRAVYKFNDTVDRYTLKPVARGYRAVVPKFARTGVSNFFVNLTTPRSSLNNFLQGKPARGFTDLGRFVVNSTLGMGGLVDVSTMIEIPEYNEDFGQTFAVWGIASGPYVYLPFLGPHTMSDVVALPLDRLAHPLRHYENTSVRDKLNVLQVIDIRTRVLSAEELIADSKDPYIAIREAYLQNRAFRIYDGDPPDSQEDEDLFEEFLNEDD